MTLVNVQTADPTQVPNVTVPVLVNPCSNGSVLQGDLCTYCTAPQYSFDPRGSNQSHQCDEPCPENAQCSGGPVMVPLAGFWMSSPFSDSIVTCPYGAACVGSNDALTACLQASNQSANPLQQVGCLHMHLAFQACCMWLLDTSSLCQVTWFWFLGCILHRLFAYVFHMACRHGMSTGISHCVSYIEKMRLFGHAGFLSIRCKHRERGAHLLHD